jgi:hypothetical protein
MNHPVVRYAMDGEPVPPFIHVPAPNGTAPPSFGTHMARGWADAATLASDWSDAMQTILITADRISGSIPDCDLQPVFNRLTEALLAAHMAILRSALDSPPSKETTPQPEPPIPSRQQLDLIDPITGIAYTTDLADWGKPVEDWEVAAMTGGPLPSQPAPEDIPISPDPQPAEVTISGLEGHLASMNGTHALTHLQDPGRRTFRSEFLESIWRIFATHPGRTYTSHSILDQLEMKMRQRLSLADLEPDTCGKPKWRAVASESLRFLWTTNDRLERIGRNRYVFLPEGAPPHPDALPRI